MTTLSAIPIREPFIDLILNDLKLWEIRSKFTKKLGPVALIRSGSGTVVAIATLSEVIQLTQKIAYENQNFMGFQGISMTQAKDFEGEYAWVLKNVVRLKTHVSYKHPPGAVTWVTLDEPTTKKVLAAAEHSS